MYDKLNTENVNCERVTWTILTRYQSFHTKQLIDLDVAYNEDNVAIIKSMVVYQQPRRMCFTKNDMKASHVKPASSSAIKSATTS